MNWNGMLDADIEVDSARTVQKRIGEQHREANRTVENRTTLRDRPVGAVVGESGTTVQDAVDAAPPNTTVLVPSGTYHGTAEIDRPITLRGTGDTYIIRNTSPSAAVGSVSGHAVVKETTGKALWDELTEPLSNDVYADGSG